MEKKYRGYYPPSAEMDEIVLVVEFLWPVAEKLFISFYFLSF